MERITIDQWQHVPAGSAVDSGFSGPDLTAPAEPGYYTLWELVDENNVHRGFTWQKEVER